MYVHVFIYIYTHTLICVYIYTHLFVCILYIYREIYIRVSNHCTNIIITIWIYIYMVYQFRSPPAFVSSQVLATNSALSPSRKSCGGRFEVATTTAPSSNSTEKMRFMMMASLMCVTWNSSKHKSHASFIMSSLKDPWGGSMAMGVPQ